MQRIFLSFPLVNFRLQLKSRVFSKLPRRARQTLRKCGQNVWISVCLLHSVFLFRIRERWDYSWWPPDQSTDLLTWLLTYSVNWLTNGEWWCTMSDVCTRPCLHQMSEHRGYWRPASHLDTHLILILTRDCNRNAELPQIPLILQGKISWGISEIPRLSLILTGPFPLLIMLNWSTYTFLSPVLAD